MYSYTYMPLLTRVEFHCCQTRIYSFFHFLNSIWTFPKKIFSPTFCMTEMTYISWLGLVLPNLNGWTCFPNIKQCIRHWMYKGCSTEHHPCLNKRWLCCRKGHYSWEISICKVCSKKEYNILKNTFHQMSWCIDSKER